jgi:tRNA splicing endonuclease
VEILENKLLIVISGPSGVGKRCIMEGIQLYCTLGLIKSKFHKIVLYNTREKREKEIDGIDYHFCNGLFLEQGVSKIHANKNIVSNNKTTANLSSNALINANPLYMYPIRETDLQGIDLGDIKNGVNFLEIYDQFMDELKQYLYKKNIKVIRIFIAPFTQNEMKSRAIKLTKIESDIIREEMNGRIRGRKELGLSAEEDKEIEKRIYGAVKEVLDAFAENNPYSAILINPCGEAHPSWGTKNTMPTGEAKAVIDVLKNIIRENI